MDSKKARLLLNRLGAEQDTDIVSNEKDYYFRKDHPSFSFSIPKDGVLSKAKWLKLLEISGKIVNHKRGGNNG